jgi:hypothetical protein
VLRWALTRAKAHLDRFLVGTVVLGIVSLFVSNTLVLPANPSAGQRLLYGVVGLMLAAAVVVVIVFGYAFLRAPYEQRAVLRDLLGQAERADAARQDQDRTEEQRRQHLQKDPELDGETFKVWELLSSGERPLIRNRTFRDCTIVGPGLITFLSKLELVESTLGSGPIESVLYEAAGPGQRQGLIGFVNCKFYRCRFDGIAYYGDSALLEKLRAGTTLI